MGAPHVFVDPADCGGGRAERPCDRRRTVAGTPPSRAAAPRLPVITPITAWADAFGPGVHGVVRWEKASTPLRDVPLGVRVDRVTVAVGSEGGLTGDEVALAGLPADQLGRTIVRVETAAVVAPALVLHRAGRLG